jgi:hypothetical protein
MNFFNRFLTAQPAASGPSEPAQPDQHARAATTTPAPAPLKAQVPAPRPIILRPEPPAEPRPSILAAALEGIPVFPIRPGSSRFAIKQSLWPATTEIAAIRQMAADYPECAFGLAMGGKVFAIRMDGDFGVEQFHSMAQYAMFTTGDNGDWTTRFLHGDNTTWALYLSPGFRERRPRPSLGQGLSIVSKGGWVPAPGVDSSRTRYRYLNPQVRIAEAPRFVAGLAFEVPDLDEEIRSILEAPSWLPR